MTAHKNYTVRYVDGFKIRNTLDDDFGIIARCSTSIAHFSPKYYIPPQELWIEAAFHAERSFLIAGEFFIDDHPEFVGMAYHKMREHLKKEFCLPGPLPTFKYSSSGKKPQIILIDGSIVRQYLDPDFIFGGHGYVYDYIPKDEIWLDRHMDPEELPYIEHHECIEYDYMRNGATYDEAHDIATASDKQLRRQKAGASYPGDKHYPWYGQTNAELLHHYYLDQ